MTLCKKVREVAKGILQLPKEYRKLDLDSTFQQDLAYLAFLVTYVGASCQDNSPGDRVLMSLYMKGYVIGEEKSPYVSRMRKLYDTLDDAATSEPRH